MNNADQFRGLVCTRVSLSVRIATGHRGVPLRTFVGDVGFVTLEDANGTRFHARYSGLDLSSTRLSPVTATVSSVGFNGDVYLKNLRVAKS